MSVPGSPALGEGSIRPDAKETTLEFWWAPPAAQVGPSIEISSYTLSCSSIPFSQSVDSSTFYIKVSSLTDAIPYSFQIVAANSRGSGPPASFRTVQPGVVPNPVTAPTVSVISTSAVQVGWTGPSSTPSIPSTGWFVVDAISTSPTISTFRVNTDGSASTITISSLNTQYASYFNIYAVNDPGYSIPMSTLAVNPHVNPGDLYTYFNILTVTGSNNYYYHIYNSQTGWGSPIDTGVDSIQYDYIPQYNTRGSIGGDSNYICGCFYNSTISTYSVPFVTTTGIPLRTITWNGTNDNGFNLPNSLLNDVFFSYSSNATNGLYDLQLYQPDSGLYQSTTFQATLFTRGSPINRIPLRNSILVQTLSSVNISTNVMNYMWSVTQSTPLFLYQTYNDEFNYRPVNSYTSVIDIARVHNCNYYDTVNYISEPSTYEVYTLPPSTYTNIVYDAFGNKGNNSYFAALYNSNTSLYDTYIWTNFSNFLNPIIISNIGSNNIGFKYSKVGTVDETHATNVFVMYDFDSTTYTAGAAIGTTYTILPSGLTYSTVYTSTTVAFTDSAFATTPFLINSNGSAILQLDTIANTISLNVCSESIGQSSIVLSSASAYLSYLSSSYNIIFNAYTNFFSLNIPLADGNSAQFITIQSDTGAITALSTNTGIISQKYCGSTGMVQYTNGFTDVLYNGVITYTTSNSMTYPTLGVSHPDFALGTMYTYTTEEYVQHDNYHLYLTLYTAHPNGTLTTTITDLGYNDGIFISPVAYFTYTGPPFRIMAQTLDDSQFFYRSNELTNLTSIMTTNNSVLFNLYNLYDTTIRTYVIFDYTSRTFNEYTEPNTIIAPYAITTYPYGYAI